MSQIPFVNRLGDAFDDAIAQTERAKRRRPRRRRFGGLAVAIFLVGAGGVTIAEIFDDPEQLATTAIACHSEVSLEPQGMAILGADGRRPTAVCAEMMHMPERRLAACVHREHVVVLPAPDACARLGLNPVPQGYDAQRAKVRRLSRELLAIEKSAECIPPKELARRAQRILDRTGWKGWRSIVTAGDGGPCGLAHDRDTDDFAPGPRHDARVLPIHRGPPRSLDLLVHGMGSPGFDLYAVSGRRCFTVDTLARRARRALAPARRPVRVRVTVGPLKRYVGLDPRSRDRRFREGCAVYDGTSPRYPRPGRIVLMVEIRVLKR